MAFAALAEYVIEGLGIGAEAGEFTVGTGAIEASEIGIEGEVAAEASGVAQSIFETAQDEKLEAQAIYSDDMLQSTNNGYGDAPSTIGGVLTNTLKDENVYYPTAPVDEAFTQVGNNNVMRGMYEGAKAASGVARIAKTTLEFAGYSTAMSSYQKNRRFHN